MLSHILKFSQQNLDNICFRKHHRHPKYQKHKVVINSLVTVGKFTYIVLNSSAVNMKKKWFETGLIISV